MRGDAVRQRQRRRVGGAAGAAAGEELPGAEHRGLVRPLSPHQSPGIKLLSPVNVDDADTFPGSTLLFIALWIAGDVMALAGAVLTAQSAWQVCLAAYFLGVDSTMLWQWHRYRHRPAKPRASAIMPTAPGPRDDDDETFLLEDMDSDSDDDAPRGPGAAAPASPLDKPLPAKPLPPLPPAAAAEARAAPGLHRRSSSTKSAALLRAGLFASAVQTAHALATTTASSSAPAAALVAREAAATTLGRALAWPPMLLYILSRFPLLRRNQRRKSTAGLSPWFIVGTFCGNGTYLLGLVADPRAWGDLGPWGARGWVGEAGSVRRTWLGLVAPYVLGSTVLMALDCCIGVQFWVYRKNRRPG